MLKCHGLLDSAASLLMLVKRTILPCWVLNPSYLARATNGTDGDIRVVGGNVILIFVRFVVYRYRVIKWSLGTLKVNVKNN